MDRSEPSLVPQWLKSSGSATGNGTTTFPISSSVLHSDDHAMSKLARNKSSLNHNDHELGWSSASDRNSSSSFRWSSSSNGHAHLRSYSSFGRNTRKRDPDKEPYEPRDREKSFVGDRKHRDYLDSPFPENLERNGLRRSQSMISGKRGEAWPKRSIADSSTAIRNKNSEGNGLLDKGNSVGSMHKATFERDFPSLGSEERQPASEIGRIPSPVLSTAIQGLTISSSAMMGADKWTSALAEVPAMVGGGGTGLSNGLQSLPSSSVPQALSTSNGLNMAETVAQGPPLVQTVPKISTGIQRFEELAIRQSRQLIPVTPSMPKPLVLNSSDKGKGKAGQLQHPTPLLAPPFRGGPVKNDASKTSNTGKLLVLKTARERNNGSTAAKDIFSPSGSKATNSAPATATSVAGSTTSRVSANAPVSPSAERKHVFPVLEKRPTSQAQSRNDFFNLVRKKSLPNSSAVPESGLTVLASTGDEPGEQEVTHAPVTSAGRDVPLSDSLNVFQTTKKNINLTCNKEAFDREGIPKNGKNHASSLPSFSEEEEAAFLHKLGWQENADEGGALTEEEISAFFRDLSKYMNSKPTLKILQGVQPKFPMLLSSQVSAVGAAASTGLNSSNSKVES